MVYEVEGGRMRRGIKTFVMALRRKNSRVAKEKFERIVKGLDVGDEYWQGYRRALGGMVAALESGDELSLLRQMINGRYPDEKIEELTEEMRVRASQDFRPEDERGYHAAWIEILQAFGEFGKKSEE